MQARELSWRTLLAAGLLVAAALANLPVVYRLLGADDVWPPLVLGFGFLSMGLGWAAGFEIEAKRRWFVVLAGAAGVAEAALVLAPLPLADVRAFVTAAGLLSALALALVLSSPRSQAQRIA